MRTFGPTTARFDHHLPGGQVGPTEQTRAIQYLAGDGIAPLAEVFQDTRVIDRAARSPWLVAHELAADLELLDLTGTYPTRAGASMLINCGARPRARAWSRAFYQACPRTQGLHSASCMHENSPSLALYERSAAAIPARPSFHRALSDQDEITEEIVTAMDVKLMQGEAARFMRKALTNPSALDASYRGWYALYHGTVWIPC